MPSIGWHGARPFRHPRPASPRPSRLLGAKNLLSRTFLSREQFQAAGVLLSRFAAASQVQVLAALAVLIGQGDMREKQNDPRNACVFAPARSIPSFRRFRD